jgi:Outer membrane protein beta-barrel domain
MKKLISTLFVLVFLAAMSFAQSSSMSNSKFTLGILGGLNIPRLSGGSGNELSRDYTSRSGPAFGLTSSLDLGSRFGLRVDVLYSSEGGKRNGTQALDASTVNPLAPAGTYFYATFDNQSILNYLEVPVMLKYYLAINKSSRVYINAGPYVGFLLNATQKTSGSSLIYADRAETMPILPTGAPALSFDASTDITSSINPINLGFTGGAGISQRAFSGDLFLDVRGAYGLIIIQKDKQNGSSHNGNLLIDLGYALHF